MSKLSKNFSAAEFSCKCCGLLNVDREFIEKLQQVRDEVKFKMIVNSGGRCESWNQKVGGVPSSYHLVSDILACRAADIAVRDPEKRYKLIKAALSVGLRGVIVYPTFVHLDLRPTLPYFNADLD